MKYTKKWLILSYAWWEYNAIWEYDTKKEATNESWMRDRVELNPNYKK